MQRFFLCQRYLKIRPDRSGPRLYWEDAVDTHSVWLKRRKRVFEIIEVGAPDDYVSRIYDFFNSFVIILNLTVSVMYTFQTMRQEHGPLLLSIENATVAFFAVDYLLRLWTARFLYPQISTGKALFKYIVSFNGIVDLLSFLPYYLPIFFPAGAVAFRMFRVVRIFRLFRINAYYDSLSVITSVLASKRQQLMSSVFIILVLMLGASLCMYSLEHEAQPEVFRNAFSGMWWAVSTLLTVGYGDIYPVTPMGQFFGICITFLGVGMVAIPTGIISAGFVDQYSRIKRISEYANEQEINFMKVHMTRRDKWVGQAIKDLGIPRGVIVAAVQRGREIVVPRGDTVIQEHDTLVLGAEAMGDDHRIELKEVVLKHHNPWNDHPIRELDISRQTVIVMVKRRGTMLIPNGDLVLKEGDKVILYTKMFLSDAETLEI